MRHHRCTARARLWATTSFLVIGPALAPAHADCGIIPFSVAQPVVERFVFQPRRIIDDNPRGDEKLRDIAAMLAMSSRASVAQMVKVVASGNVEQRRAVATGLAWAARRCERLRPSEAVAIEAAVKASPDAILKREFTATYKSRATQAAETARDRERAGLRASIAPQATELRRSGPFAPDTPLSGGVGRLANPNLPIAPSTRPLPSIRSN